MCTSNSPVVFGRDSSGLCRSVPSKKGGELKSADIKRTIGAAILGTHMEKAFKVETVWRKMNWEYPAEKLQAVKLIGVDDSRALWTTFTNLQH